MIWHVEGKGKRRQGRKGDLLLIMEPNLSGCHTDILVQVRPGCVNDCYIVFLVAYHSPLSLTAPKAEMVEGGDTPSIEFAFVNCAQSSNNAVGSLFHSWPSLRRR